MKIAIAGATGRMGGTLIEGVLKDGALTLAAALEMPGHAALGKDAGGVALRADIDGAVAACDALIDFTRPAGALAHLDACVRAGKMMVIGTTGFSAAEQAKIDAASRRIAVMMAPNFAVGVNVLFKLAGDAAKALGNDFDVEIVEAHHRHKVDAPSGTALALGEAAAAGRAVALNEAAVRSRDGITGPRKAGAIGFANLRGGDVVGDHTVIFAAEGERLELGHKASSRQIFARGALRAALWARGKPPGLYSMQDVLGFSEG